MTPYELPQQWALQLRRVRSGRYPKFGGLIYFARHDPAASRSLALFGREGDRKSWPKGRERPIDSDLLNELRASYGVRVEKIPHSRELVIR